MLFAAKRFSSQQLVPCVAAIAFGSLINDLCVIAGESKANDTLLVFVAVDDDIDIVDDVVDDDEDDFDVIPLVLCTAFHIIPYLFPCFCTRHIFDY